MTSASDLIQRAESLGASFELRDGGVKVKAKRPLPPELMTELRERKAEVLTHLRQQTQAAEAPPPAASAPAAVSDTGSRAQAFADLRQQAAEEGGAAENQDQPSADDARANEFSELRRQVAADEEAPPDRPPTAPTPSAPPAPQPQGPQPSDAMAQDFAELRRQAVAAEAPPDQPQATPTAPPVETTPPEEQDSDWHSAFEQLAEQRGVAESPPAPASGAGAIATPPPITDAGPPPVEDDSMDEHLGDQPSSGTGLLGRVMRRARPSTANGGVLAQLADAGRDLLATTGLGGPREVTTITLEHGFIKVLVTRGLEVVDHRVVEAPTQVYREGLVSEPMRIATLIQRTLNGMEGKHKRIIGAVPGYQSTLREIELPNAKGLDPAVIIPREARRTMGISPDSSSLDWHKLPSGGEMSKWLVVSATNRSAGSLEAVARAASLQMSAVELRPFALTRAVSLPEAICAWTAEDGCDAFVVQNWVPVAHQAAYWGASSSVDSTDLVNRVTEVVESTINVYNEQNPDLRVTDEIPVVVTGTPSSREPSVARRVASNLRRPQAELDPPLQLPDGFPIHDFVVNIGLALWDA